MEQDWLPNVTVWCRVQGARLRVQGLGYRVEGLVFRVEGLLGVMKASKVGEHRLHPSAVRLCVRV